jgi:hypothetical protein
MGISAAGECSWAGVDAMGVNVGLTMMRKSRRQNAATYYGEAESGKARGIHVPDIFLECVTGSHAEEGCWRLSRGER